MKKIITVEIIAEQEQARKNGWNKPIPKGFNHFMVGKLRRNIFTFIGKENI